jgi:hypothetical protein
MNVFETNAVQRELCSLFSSNLVEAKIRDALKSGQSEFNQKLLLGVQDIANAVVEDFKKQLRTELQTATNDWVTTQNALEIVPSGTKYLGSLGNGKVCIVEYGPSLRTLDFKSNGFACGGVGKFRLAFPYVVFIVRLANNPDYYNALVPQLVYIGCRTKPLQSLDDRIHNMNLPNCDVDHHICLGGAWSYMVRDVIAKNRKPSLSEMVEGVISYFWNSGFNNDLCDTFISHAKRNPKVMDLRTWQENSTKDPLFVMNLDWGRSTPISGFLERNVGEAARLNTARIVDRVLVDASRRLTDYLKMAGQVNVSSQKSADIMKNALYESLTTSCGRILDSARGKIEQEANNKVADAISKAAAEKQKLELQLKKEVQPDRIKRYEDGDYLYHPPTVEVW